MFGQSENSELAELKLKVKILEKMSGATLDSWLEDYAQEEHNYHEKMNELVIREGRLLDREMMFNKEIEAKISIAKGENEVAYYHSLHSNLEEMNERYAKLVDKIIDKLPSVNLEDISPEIIVNK